MESFANAPDDPNEIYNFISFRLSDKFALIFISNVIFIRNRLRSRSIGGALIFLPVVT